MINGMAVHQATRAANRGRWVVVVARRWKHLVLQHYLQGADGISFHTHLPRSDRVYRDANFLLVWGRQTCIPEALLRRHPHLHVVTAEDGFISTRGLGLTGSFFYSLLLDRQGIHFDASKPNDLRDLLNNHPFSAADEQLGRDLITLIRSNGLSKCNLREQGAAQPGILRGERPILLAIGQLENDQALQCSLSPIRTNLQLLQEIRCQQPEAWVVFKPHPIQLRTGGLGRSLARQYLKYCNQLALEGNITEWIDAVDAVHLISSTTGLEALIRNRAVHTYGTPAYAGWGITQDWAVQPNRKRQLSLEQLVAITHGIYPRYFNWGRGQFESAVETLNYLINLENGQQSEHFFDPVPQRAQQRIQRWREGRVDLLSPWKRWRIQRLKTLQ